MVNLKVGFRAYGCDYSQQQQMKNENCTSYNFDTTVTVAVNLATDVAYVNGQPQGLANFWEPPLTNGGALNAGTGFVGGKPYTVVGNASTPVSSGFGVAEVNDSGLSDSGPFYLFQVTGITFGTGPNHTFGYEHINATGYYSGNRYIDVFYLDPYGGYDYWNGLAYYFSIPDYPINQTVCNTLSGQALDCRYVSYATTLGNYFRSGGGELGLVSTNVPLGSSQASETTTSNVAAPLYISPYAVIAVVVIVAGILSGFLLGRRRNR